jgi:hypothetical protein
MERTKNRLKGGLGLMRLVLENKFNIAANYDGKLLIVEAQIELGGLLI